MTAPHPSIRPAPAASSSGPGTAIPLARLRVTCYAGYRTEETPRRLLLDGRKVEVDDVLDRWQSPQHRYAKIRGDDGRVYTLRHDSHTDHWDMVAIDPR